MKLTREQIEDWREVFEKKYSQLAAITNNSTSVVTAKQDLHDLCDMAIAALSLEQDAKRYRWLRDQTGEQSVFISMRSPHTVVSRLTFDYADAAIDAAMESTK